MGILKFFVYNIANIVPVAYLFIVKFFINKQNVDGINVYYYNDDEYFVESLKSALMFIKDTDAKLYKQVKKYLLNIAYYKMGRNTYFPMIKLYSINSFSNEVLEFACSLIHESKHGYMHAKGFLYIGKDKARHEKICLKEEKIFLKKIVKSNYTNKSDLQSKLLEIDNKYNNLYKLRWWENKQKILLSIYALKIISKKSFRYILYYPPNKIYFEVNIKKGKKDGKYSEYYYSGILKEEGFYKNDILDGESKKYFENGCIDEHYFYKNGVFDGEFRYYYENTQIKQEGVYVNGLAHGLVKWYNESGNLSLESNYSNGEYHGVSKWYDEKGNCTKSVNYENGELIK